MTAIELLKNDHREALSMIEQLESTGEGATASSRIEVFNQLKGALTLHTKLEEQFFYPALENFDETRDLIKESYKEHREVDELLTKMSGQSEDWEDQLSELKGDIEHHVDEEENEMFPQAEELLGQRRLQEIGREMEEMKQGQSATA